jgi:hypothetical protein
MTALLPIMASLLLFAGCKRHHKVPEGLWKLDKIEVLRNNELKKIIDTGQQYWKFYKADSLEISDAAHVQKSLRIKAGKDSFMSLDHQSGNAVDEFVIDKLNKQELELSSRKTIENDDYTVVYYLERID